MGIKDCFAQYGATLKNVNWSVSAESPSGELVVSLWKQFFTKPVDKTITYIDKVSRWNGLGNDEFKRRIAKAFDNKQPVRVVIARTDNEEAVKRGEDASNFKNRFHVRKDWLGEVTLWDGDNFQIHFEQQ